MLWLPQGNRAGADYFVFVLTGLGSLLIATLIIVRAAVLAAVAMPALHIAGAPAPLTIHRIAVLLTSVADGVVVARIRSTRLTTHA